MFVVPQLSGKFSRGLEFGTQPYDEPRRDAIAKNGMFGASTFRWLPAKSAIHSSFLMFYALTPADFGKVENVRFENGVISIEDGAKQKIELRASLPLESRPPGGSSETRTLVPALCEIIPVKSACVQ